MPRWLRIGWEKLDARLIDRKFVERGSYNVHSPGSFQVWDYMVELDTGERLVIREKSFKLDLPEGGKPVPVMVNRRRTKAAFDLDDPRIDAIGRLEAKQKRRKERDEQRFREKLGG